MTISNSEALFLFDTMLRFPQHVPDSRFRVDLKSGYVSYSAMDYEKAFDIFSTEGVNIRVCKDIHDEGVVIAGEILQKEEK